MKMGVISDIRPFRMYGNLYFVGSTRVSVHILKTEEGLVMIDSGYPDMFDIICDSMEKVGLSPKDLCAIIHTHGHIDHTGTTLRFKKLSGAKTYISRIDNDIINGKKDLSWAKELKYEKQEEFDCDVLLEDGDILTFGTTSIRFASTPGHTEGTMSFFVDLCEKGKKITAAMHGGAGLNTLSEKYLEQNGLPLDLRDAYKQSITKLSSEKVDLVLGNHPQQNDTSGKGGKVLLGESIIDPSEWNKFLDFHRKALDDLIEKEKTI